jgi:MtN3 and saliva related transmembrane protein
MEWGQIIGLLGMLLLVSAWIPQTWETIKTKKCPLNLQFIVIYVVAATLLTIYSWIIGDWIFFTLNFLSTFQSAINLVVKIMEK